MQQLPQYSDLREAERQQRREYLLLAAVRMFNARGFHETSLEDIAGSLGLTKPAIYHHLGNKEHVLFQCLNRGFDEMLEAADVAAKSPGTGADRVTAYLQQHTKLVMSDFGRCVARTTYEMLSKENEVKIHALKSKVQQKLSKLIIAGVKDGSIRSSDPKLAACALVAAVSWPAMIPLAEFDEGMARSANEVVDLLIHGLSPR